MIRSRFAPSPTGSLHIGGARTALFNWLFAKKSNGKFLLRIEDTDRERSTQDNIQQIYKSLQWLGIDWDEEPLIQSTKCLRHVELAKELVAQGKAYHCYCITQELEEMRNEAKKNGLSPKYNGYWRDRDQNLAPKNVSPAIRLKVPQNGSTVLNDIVQGTVTVDNKELDDMVLVRSDGSPTFMLSVVVDDHDMSITHVFRGDDHLTNTFRQIQLFNAFGWGLPKFGHIPLIHGSDGAKLSKRHGALSVEAYKEMGYLPEAICNGLLRLGWSHGDDEIISMNQAIEWFTPDNLGKSPSRLDFAKLENLNAHYMRQADNERLLNLMLGHMSSNLLDEQKSWILKGMNGLKQRAKTVIDLCEIAKVYTDSHEIIKFDEVTSGLLKKAEKILNDLSNWSEISLETCLRDFAKENEISFGKVAQSLRNVLTNKKITPSIFEMLYVFGKIESINRIKTSIN